MEGLIDLNGGSLHWVEPKAFEHGYELRDDQGALYGSMSFRTALGSLAVAEMALGAWSFKRVGFLNPRVTVRVKGQEVDAALFHPKFAGGGRLEFADGTSFQWRSTNFWQSRWAFFDGRESPLVEFTPGPSAGMLSDLFKTQATVTCHEGGVAAEILSMLVALGFYLILLHKQDMETAVVVTAASS